MKSNPKGYVSFVLHAHLPFVHHPESEDYLEEQWLYEAISETYIPLLTNFHVSLFYPITSPPSNLLIISFEKFISVIPIIALFFFPIDLLISSIDPNS